VTSGVEDIQAIAARWGQTRNRGGWNPKCDLNLDGAIRTTNIMLASAQWGRTCP
jgi:hypothetical protein